MCCQSCARNSWREAPASEALDRGCIRCEATEESCGFRRAGKGSVGDEGKRKGTEGRGDYEEVVVYIVYIKGVMTAVVGSVWRDHVQMLGSMRLRHENRADPA